MKTRFGCVTSNMTRPKLKNIWRRCPPSRPMLLPRHPHRRRRTSNSIDSVGKALPNLPFDIQLNIISRLSIKLIFGCKSLSKAFEAAISEPSFTRIYQNNYYSSSSINPIFIKSSGIDVELVELERGVYTNNNNPIISKCTRFRSARGKLTDGVYGGERYRDASNCSRCNGLLCLLKPHSGILNMFVINPLSGEFIKLPDPVTCKVWFMANGLGYCHTTGRYKVLRMVKEHGGKRTDCDIKTEILTIGVDKNWRTVLDVNTPFSVRACNFGPMPQSYMVAFRSALHWIATPKGKDGRFEMDPKLEGNKYIDAFSLTEEKVCAIPFPSEVGNSYILKIGVLMDKLCCWNSTKEKEYINIWIMNEYGVEGSWTKQFTLIVSRLPHNFVYPCFTVLSVSIRDHVIMVAERSRLVFYDLKTNYSLHCINLIDSNYNTSYIRSFVPDFVSLKDRQGFIANV